MSLHDTSADLPSSRNASQRRWRSLPYAVFIVLMCTAVLLAITVNAVVQDQEKRLLNQQVAAADALVSSYFGGVGPTLPLLGALDEPGVGSPVAFQVLAQNLVKDGGTAGTAVRRDDSFVVRNAVGDGPSTGTFVETALSTLVSRATRSDDFVTDVFERDGHPRLAFAVVSPTSRDVVAYVEFPLDGSTPALQGRGDPFRELAGAVYAGDRADPSKLVLTTTRSLPINGSPIAVRRVSVGADQWLIVAAPKGVLIGELAKNLPWILFAVGLLAAALMSALIRSITRRRTYALALVDERTQELRVALAERERLEEGQRLAREAAEAANESKSEFLSRMSHELRTPLNAVLGFAQLLETDELTELQHDSVHQIVGGGRHLLNLINEVLDITRIETRTFQLSPEPVLASDVVSEVIELTRPLAVNANIQLIRGSTADGGDTYVLADHQRLKQILLNLVANAIKYNRPGGTVIVSCEHTDPSSLRLKVRDTGPGIRPEHRDLLFTPFERLGAERTGIEGTGVGLALSQRLAEAMGGTIDLETSLGHGSTFWVELPIVEGPIERYERLDGGATPAMTLDTPASPARAKVLYIEDNLPNVRLVQRIIDGHPETELITAMQGRIGLELAREHQPALVLLDAHLPDISGSEVLRHLRDDPATASIPVVVISADATAGQIKRMLAEGASSYLTKPLDVSALRELLDTLPTPV